jgi:hypothetical protein
LFKLGFGFQKLINNKSKITNENIELASLFSLLTGIILINITLSILIFTNIYNKVISLTIVLILFLFVEENFFSKNFFKKIVNKNKKSLFYLGFFILLILFYIINPYKFFIGSGDSTSHYIPFFSSIKNLGGYIKSSIEIPWYHIFQNKGDGFHFFTSLIADPVLIKNNNLIIFCISILLIRFILKKYNFSEFSFFLLFLFLIGNFKFNLFTTHLTHILFLSFIGFYFFLTTENKLNAIERQTVNNFDFINIIVFFFIGYYQPLYISFYLTLIILLICILRLTKIPIKLFSIMLIIIILGSFISILINFYFTGLFETIPFKLNLKIGDDEKFHSIFGIANTIFFLEEQKSIESFNLFFFINNPIPIILSNLIAFIKIYFNNFSIYIIILPIHLFFYFFFKFKKKEINLKNINKKKFIIFKKNNLLISVNYLFIYCIVSCLVFFLFFIITMNHSSYERFSAIIFLFSGLIYIYFAEMIFVKCNKNYKFFFCIVLFIYSLTILKKNISYKDVVVTTKIFISHYSIKDSLESYEANKGELNFIIKSKQIIGNQKKIYTFNHFPHSLIFYPEKTLLHEPSYSLGYCFSALINNGPESFINFFKKNNIDYIIYDESKPIFSFLKYSKYLNKHNLSNFFDVVYAENNLKLLKFKNIHNINFQNIEMNKNKIQTSINYSFDKKCEYN